MILLGVKNVSESGSGSKDMMIDKFEKLLLIEGEIL